MADSSRLTEEQKEKVSARWGQEPDAAVNWATIPHVNRRAAEMIGADPVKGFWLHMLDLYSDAERPLGRVLSLACGHGHQERTLARFRKFRVCDAFDVSDQALENARRLAQAEGLQNINYERRDLNDLKLSETYDLVVAGGIHHVGNLERLFSEINRCLTPRGFLLMYEYIGPSQCQPTARQVEAINACIRLLPRKYRVRTSAQRKLGVSTPEEALAIIDAPGFDPENSTKLGGRVAAAAPEMGSSSRREAREAPVAPGIGRGLPLWMWLAYRSIAGLWRGDFRERLGRYLLRHLQAPLPDPLKEYFWDEFVPMTREQWNAVDPSEAVRSHEIIPLLRKHFVTVDVRYTGGSIMQFALYDIAGNFYEDSAETRDILDMLFRIEEVLVKHDDVPQDYAVIVAKNG